MQTSLNHNAPHRANENARLGILSDLNSKGKERPWTPRKRQSIAVTSAFECTAALSPKTLKRLTECADYLEFDEFAVQETGECRKRLKRAFFCKHRLCPMCQWRRSVLLHQQLTQVVEIHLDRTRRPKDRALMLTLTMRNCSADDLAKTISEMSRAFRRLSDTPRVKRAVVGWFRSLEVTYNAATNEYHPHLHVLLMVPPEYFDPRRDLYIETRDFVDMWRRALRVDYTPVCDVRRVGKGQAGSFTKAMRKGLLEVTKYCTKPDDWIKLGADGYEVDPQVALALLTGLKHKRLVGWGGTLKAIWKELHLEDVESDEADLVGESDTPEGWERLGVIRFSFGGLRRGVGSYFRLPDRPEPEPPDRTLH